MRRLARCVCFSAALTSVACTGDNFSPATTEANGGNAGTGGSTAGAGGAGAEMTGGGAGAGAGAGVAGSAGSGAGDAGAGGTGGAAGQAGASGQGGSGANAGVGGSAGAGANAGVGGSAGAGANAGVGGSAGAGLCPIVYVDGDGGEDVRTGCAPDKAVKSLDVGIARAQKLTKVTELRICATQEAYPTSGVVIDAPIHVTGGWTCGPTEWAQTEAARTKIVSQGTPGAERFTIALGPATLSLSQVDVTGPAGGKNDSETVAGVALLVRAGSKANVSRATFRGAAESATGPTLGARVAALANPELATSLFFGGRGTLDAPALGTAQNRFASAGLLVEGDVRVNTRSEVFGGEGTSVGTSGSAGILLQGAQAKLTMDDTRVDGGSGKSKGGAASVGIVAGEKTSVSIARSKVEGGNGSVNVAGTFASTRGVLAGAQSKITVVRSVLYGGRVASPGSGHASVALAARRADDVRIENSVLRGAETDAVLPGDHASTALVCAGVIKCDLTYTTLIAAGAQASGLVASDDEESGTLRGSVTSRGSLFLVQNGLALAVRDGTSSNVTMHGNAFFSETSSFASLPGLSAKPETGADLTSALGANGSENARLGAFPAFEINQKACGTLLGCRAELFRDSIDASELGDPFALDGGLPCKLVKLFTAAGPLPTNDIFGDQRPGGKQPPGATLANPNPACK